VAQSLINRSQNGVWDSAGDLVGMCLQAHPDEEKAAGLFVQLSERIFLKTLTSPLNNHTTLCAASLLHLLESTDLEYHTQLQKALLKMMEALYKEFKKGSQESFKKKVLFKLNYAICIMMG
jgi:hypothetical protein